MTQVNRKRARNMEEDASEFTPLSKRINNLHINGLSGFNDTAHSTDNTETEWSNGNYRSSPLHLEPSQSSTSSDGYSSNQINFGQEYQPDLNANDNPYYYENNKLLYSLYIERMHRRVNLNNV
ncbi:hypothetical protein PV327_002059 [Microctonus hyperodae]|uniref:Uncharacterized protein n=1 Tax=Microctonus hyperodae TaxID=165561 RepID=A0AA39KNP8_MICHY|nr:hypothetical protein PV327_002059 [Microctonus hyperodae]